MNERLMSDKSQLLNAACMTFDSRVGVMLWKETPPALTIVQSEVCPMGLWALLEKDEGGFLTPCVKGHSERQKNLLRKMPGVFKIV